MIIGTITLITILFFGGVQQGFFINKLEKGIKTYITEEDRRKEIQVDLKASKEIIKAFNKNRRSKLKELKAMNLDSTISRNKFDIYYRERNDERLAFQDELISERALLTAKINDDEWEKIINLSNAEVDKIQEKESRKKQKDDFQMLYQSVEKNIKDQDRSLQAKALVQNMEARFDQFLTEMNTLNSRENELISDKYAKVEDMRMSAKELNSLRLETYESLVDFHFDLFEVCQGKEWTSVMKTVNKLLPAG